MLGVDAARARARVRRGRDRRRATVLVATTDVGARPLLERRDGRRVAVALAERGALAGRRRGGRDPADRARPPALRRRHERREPARGARARGARGQLHEGLLRRAGAGRPNALPRPPEPAPAWTRAVRAGRDPASRCERGEREVGTIDSACVSPPSARSRSRSFGARSSPGDEVPSARRRARREVVDATVRGRLREIQWRPAEHRLSAPAPDRREPAARRAASRRGRRRGARAAGGPVRRRRRRLPAPGAGRRQRAPSCATCATCSPAPTPSARSTTGAGRSASTARWSRCSTSTTATGSGSRWRESRTSRPAAARCSRRTTPAPFLPTRR